MELPVCNICRFVPVKCKVCEQRFLNGELTEADFEVSRAIARVECDIDLKKAFNVGKSYIADFKGTECDGVRGELGKPLIRVTSSSDLLAKLKIKTRPSVVFSGGVEKKRIALNKNQLKSQGFTPEKIAEALNYWGVEATLV